MHKRDLILRVIEAVKLVPSVKPLLSDEVVFKMAMLSPRAYKTYETMLENIRDLVDGAYNGDIGTTDFTSEMSSIYSGQIKNAFHNAWIDSEYGGNVNYLDYPDYLETAEQEFLFQTWSIQYAYQYYNDIIAARLTQSPASGVMARAELWAARWSEAYNQALQVIAQNMGGKLKWIEGDTLEKCEVCTSLDGIVAYAKLWDSLGVYPQSAPNDHLACGGWRCQCYFEVTNEKVTPDAKRKIQRAIAKAKK